MMTLKSGNLNLNKTLFVIIRTRDTVYSTMCRNDDYYFPVRIRATLKC